jgi:hypothetical protein
LLLASESGCAGGKAGVSGSKEAGGVAGSALATAVGTTNGLVFASTETTNGFTLAIDLAVMGLTRLRPSDVVLTELMLDV